VPDVTVEYQWTRDEYLRVIRKGALPRAIRYQYLVGVFMICAGVVLGIEGNAGSTLFLCVLGVAFIAYWLWIPRTASTKSWSRNVGLRGPIKIEVTDSGVWSTTDAGETKLTWEVFPRSKEWSDYYFIMRSKVTVATIIPKRAISSPVEEANLRNLFRAHTSSQLVPNQSLDVGKADS
jgi:YcxB-like protein